MHIFYRNEFGPFRLSANLLLFHDWRFVSHGGFSWLGPDDQKRPLWGQDPVPEMHFVPRDIPWGIRLAVQQPHLDEPCFLPEKPWEFFVGASALVHEEGRYRLWYETCPPADFDKPTAGEGNVLCYAESDDGLHWERPSLGLAEYEGSTENNIVFGGSLSRQFGFHGGCVFRDPSAPPEERYKTFHLGLISPEALAKYRRERPEDVDPHSLRSEGRVWGLCGGVSPDGLHWTALPEPLLVHTSDTHNICHYDPALQKYVAYVRTWYYGRRSIGRTETDDFRRFPPPEVVVFPGPDLGPTDLWYANGKTLYPGTTEYHLMFPLLWRVAEDRWYVHLATSPEGKLWAFPPGSEILRPGLDGSWNAAGGSVGYGMVPLPGDRVGVMYSSIAVPHKYPRRLRPLYQTSVAQWGAGWVWWPKGRLVAVEARERGEFMTVPLLFEGQEARLNFRTAPSGSVLVEAVGTNGVLPGRSFADGDPLHGDHLARPISWRGETHLPRQEEEPVSFRFRLHAAEVFGVEFG
jgi:hypothetical protein